MTASPASSPNSAAAAGGRTKSIVSLVLGIVSLLAIFIPLLGGAGIAAVIVGAIARRSEPSGARMALIGIILGIVGFVLWIIGFVIGLQTAAAILEQQGL